MVLPGKKCGTETVETTVRSYVDSADYHKSDDASSSNRANMLCRN